VKRTHARAGRDAPNLQIERMAAAPRSAIADTAQRERDVAEERVKLAGGRLDLVPMQRRNVDAVHSVQLDQPRPFVASCGGEMWLPKQSVTQLCYSRDRQIVLNYTTFLVPPFLDEHQIVIEMDRANVLVEIRRYISGPDEFLVV
jgi:hypothetical protein